MSFRVFHPLMQQTAPSQSMQTLVASQIMRPILPVFFEQYVLDGQEGHLSHTFTITIAPVSAAEAASRPPRRPSMAGDSPRRSTSDSFLCQTSRRCAFSNDQLFHLIAFLGLKHAPTRPRPEVPMLFRQALQNQKSIQVPSLSPRTNGS
jgi:hypothetical protein